MAHGVHIHGFTPGHKDAHIKEAEHDTDTPAGKADPVATSEIT